MDKVYIVEITHESGEKERREVEATHIIEAFQKGPYDPYATMVIVKEKVSRDYKAEIAYLTAENERLRGEVEEQKSIAEHEHATQMEWFSIAGDYKAENADLHERLKEAEHRAEVEERALVIIAERVLEYAQKAKVTAMTSGGLFSYDKDAQLALLVNDALLKAEQKMARKENNESDF